MVVKEMTSNATAVWLPRVIFESALITLSILLALGLDEWRDDRQDQEMIEQALSNFLSEVRQNKARVDDAAPFNIGLRNVLRSRYENGDIKSIAEFVAVVESYSPVVLQSTAWETALATGSLAKMEYSLVAALSLTYGMQDRYQQTISDRMSDLTSPQNLSAEKLELAVYNSVRYLDDTTKMETELAVVFEEVESVIRNAWVDMDEHAREEIETWSRDVAHP